MCSPKLGLEPEGDPALINPLLKSIYTNVQTYQTRGKSRFTYWNFYSKFLLYNSFVYAKMYGKIYQRVEELESMCENIESYVNEQVIKMAVELISEYEDTKEAIVKKIAERFNLTREDAENYYLEVQQ